MGQPMSIESDVKTSIKFVNKTAGTVRIVWLDYDGKRVPYGTIKPGGSLNQSTYERSPWIVLDSAGTCIGYVVAVTPARVYTIESPQQGAQPGSAEGAQATDQGAVNVTVGGPGVVEGGGIECGGSRNHCSLSNLKSQEPVTLHAVPGPGARFVGWFAGGCTPKPNSGYCKPVSECAAARSPTCTVRPSSGNNGNAQVSATFATTSPPAGNQPFRLSVKRPFGRGYPILQSFSAPADLKKSCGFSPGGIFSPCGGSLASGTAVTIDAGPDVLQSWQGSCVGTASVCRLVVDGPTEVIFVANPNFSQGEGFAVTVSVVGGGKVTGPGIDCSSKCTFNNLEVLDLTATPGQKFLGWIGNPCARFRNKTRCFVSLTDKAKVTAKFSS
jgi:hypothetical protein